jgi:hypothetical protein
LLLKKIAEIEPQNLSSKATYSTNYRKPFPYTGTIYNKTTCAKKGWLVDIEK